MPPLRILYVITKANWGGAQRYVYDLATAAKAMGHEVLVASGPEGELTERLAAAGVPYRSLPSLARDVRLGAEFRVFNELRDLIREFRPVVVHGNSSKAGGLAALAARLEGVRSVFTAHGWAFNERRPAWQRLLIWLMHYATVFLADRTVCVSRAAKRDARLMPLVGHKISVIHNGVGAIDFIPRDTARAQLAPAKAASFWIGTIAELHPTKQIHILLRAFSELAARHADLTLVLMGDGQERERLMAYARRLGIEDQVVFCGHIPEAARHLKALDLFALPSRSEGLGYVLLEAGRAGLPVVASKVGGIPEIIEHGATGVLVPPGNPGALAAAIEALIADPALSTRLGGALSEKTAAAFSLERMVKETFALYR